MIKEFAVQPEALCYKSEPRWEVLNDLRIHNGRVLVVPHTFKRWAKDVLWCSKACLRQRAHKQLEEKLRNMELRREFFEIRQEGDSNWSDTLGAMAASKDLQAIIVQDAGLPGKYGIDAGKVAEMPYDRENPPMKVVRSEDIERTPDATFRWAEKFIRLSNHLIYIDSYYTATDEDIRQLTCKMATALDCSGQSNKPSAGRLDYRLQIHTTTRNGPEWEEKGLERLAEALGESNGPALQINYWHDEFDFKHDRYLYGGRQAHPQLATLGAGIGKATGKHMYSYHEVEQDSEKWQTYETFRKFQLEGNTLKEQYGIVDGKLRDLLQGRQGQ